MMDEEKIQTETAGPPSLIRVVAVVLIVLGVAMMASAVYWFIFSLGIAKDLRKSIADKKSYIEAIAGITDKPEPRKADPMTGEETDAHKRYMNALKMKARVKEGIKRDERSILQRIRPAQYEIYFTVVDLLLVLGGVGLLLSRNWGRRLVLLGLFLTPLYAAFNVWILMSRPEELGRIPIWYYLFAFAAVPIVWLFWYLNTKAVKDLLLPKKDA
ncbi:MAG: hypothetical protein ACYS8W_21055 [Planctomycetota bacterium]|jgi:hypothetical protein